VILGDVRRAHATRRLRKTKGALSLLNGCDFDGSDEGLVTVNVCVAFGQNTHRDKFVFAELLGQGFKSPTQNHHVGGGEGEYELLRRRVRVVAGVRVWFNAVANQLAGVEALTMFLVKLELDTGAILIQCFITMLPRDFFGG
jgi:hypothetical protein